MFRPANNFFHAALLVALAGCAHVPDIRSVPHKQAMTWESRGEKAYLAGSIEQSRRSYETALQINTSIENAHGIASDMLSLAQINLDCSEYDQAETRLRFVLDDPSHLFAAADKADAAARSARLALLLKQPERAAELVQQAERLCRDADCSIAASILNLYAQAALALGRIEDSADMARRAGAIAGKSQQPVELANSQRLQGEILLRSKSANEAVPLLEQALALDKQLGLARRIAEDLQWLAEAEDMQGRREEAKSSRSRERAIRSALGDKGQ